MCKCSPSTSSAPWWTGTAASCVRCRRSTPRWTPTGETEPYAGTILRSGELGWTRIDELHRIILDGLLPRFGLAHLSEAERQHLNRVWHRLEPWPDTLEGLQRLKRHYTITTLSNGNIGLLTNMAKRAGLPWDCILSAEVWAWPAPSTWRPNRSCWWPSTRTIWMRRGRVDCARRISSGRWSLARGG